MSLQTASPGVPAATHPALYAPPPAGYRPDIDGLRAIAVSAVVLFHAFPGLLPGGFAGVDIFFVISGFLIGGILIDAHAAGTFTYRDFYARRVRRLFPALVAVLACVLVAGFLLLVPSDFRSIGKHTVAGAGFAANLVLLKESGYFDTASALKPLLHLWSLGVEEQSYILCPLLLALAWRLRVPVGWLIAAVAVGSFLLGLHWLDSMPKKAFFHPAARFWELFAGVALAAAQRSNAFFSGARGTGLLQRIAGNHSPRTHEAIAVCGLLLLAAGFALLAEGRDFPGFSALLPVLGAALLIAVGARSALLRVLVANRPMVFVGLISYPLYLWHWPLLSFARIHAGGEPALLLRVALVLLAVLLAWATWRWIEMPLRHARAGFPATRVLLVAMAVVVAAGIGVQVTDGAAWRYPDAVRHIAAFDYDEKKAMRAGSCFLKSEQTAADFAAGCLAPAGHAARPRVLLWGDSHAAHLYPGLAERAAAAPGFALVQLTASGCPPVPGVDIANRPACRGINDFVFHEIRRLQPDVVVLGGYWHQYNGTLGWNRVDAGQLRATIAALRAAGVARVVLVGQVPIWEEAQPRLILRLWEEQQAIVDYTAHGLDTASLQTDERLREQLAGSGAEFVSPTDLFCIAGRCMTFSGSDHREPVAFDYGHLTRSGSLLLATRIQKAFVSSPEHHLP